MARTDLRHRLWRLERRADSAYRRATSSRRPLPTFLIIGAQKAGTTSLHEWLAAHPDVGRPVTKEVHYFDHEAHRPLSWYRAQFHPAPAGAHVGEATPYYLFHPLCPARVYAALPDVKLIVLARDPVERARSHYDTSVALGFEQLDLRAALAREPERLEGEEERLLADPGYRSFAHQNYSYAARGMYARQLERWREHFPAEQMLVLVSEELFAAPADVLHRVQAWLGLTEQTPPVLARHRLRTETSSLPDDLRAELRAKFAPDTARFTAMTRLQVPWG